MPAGPQEGLRQGLQLWLFLLPPEPVLLHEYLVRFLLLVLSPQPQQPFLEINSRKLG